ncbi:predicted protein [Histoplasma capsulatum H143]|uniref:Uncharacterized protein n=1 Tax=Ajellomyces capsulatus (strain H143) TaxID=544712 RepID=C6HCK4_AJECH|nr:predicted protein [Histoplasma capsulatum H143]
MENNYRLFSFRGSDTDYAFNSPRSPIVPPVDANHRRIHLVRTKRVSQSSPRSAQSKQEGGAAPCRRGDSCDRGDLPYVENPPNRPSPIRRVGGKRWDPERTGLPHAGEPAEGHTHWVPRKTGLMLTACVRR